MITADVWNDLHDMFSSDIVHLLIRLFTDGTEQVEGSASSMQSAHPAFIDFLNEPAEILRTGGTKRYFMPDYLFKAT